MDMKENVEELFRKRASTLDPARPNAVQERKDFGKLTALQRIDPLCDP